MRSQWGNPVAVAREIQGQFSPERDKIVLPPLYVDVCKLIWPNKTALHLAEVGGVDERTAKRWLAGEYDPPLHVALFLFNKIFEKRNS